MDRSVRPGTLIPIYPPLGWGGNTGSVLGNVLQIQQAELVFFNVTPETAPGEKPFRLNPGVMIELGIVLDREHPANSLPQWDGVQPKPTFHLFCDEEYSRSLFTPVLGDIPIQSYSEDPKSTKFLAKLLEEALRIKLSAKANFKIQTYEAQRPLIPPTTKTLE